MDRPVQPNILLGHESSRFQMSLPYSMGACCSMYSQPPMQSARLIRSGPAALLWSAARCVIRTVFE